MIDHRRPTSQRNYRVGLIGLSPIAIKKYLWKDQPGPKGQELPVSSAPPSHSLFGDEVATPHARAIDFIPELDIAAVCDVSPERLNKWNKNWGIRWPSARPYLDYTEMLSRESLDIVGVATPEFLHAKPMVTAAESGVRGILCEKPLATSLEDADRMIHACEANGVVLNVEYTRRFSPLLQTIREAIRSGAIGTVCSISGSFGGVQSWLFRTGSHIIDTMCFFTESDPVPVFAQLEDGYEDWDRYKGSGGGNQTERDPGAIGYILSENGVRGYLSSMKDSTDIYRVVTVVGTAGYGTFDTQGLVAEVFTPDPASPMKSTKRELMSEPVRFGPLEAAYPELIDNIENQTPSVSPAREARKSAGS